MFAHETLDFDVGSLEPTDSTLKNIRMQRNACRVLNDLKCPASTEYMQSQRPFLRRAP